MFGAGDAVGRAFGVARTGLGELATGCFAGLGVTVGVDTTEGFGDGDGLELTVGLGDGFGEILGEGLGEGRFSGLRVGNALGSGVTRTATASVGNAIG